MSQGGHGEGEGFRVLYLATHHQQSVAADAWIQVHLAGAHRPASKARLACRTSSATAPTPVSRLLQEFPDLQVVELDLGPVRVGGSRAAKATTAAQSLVALPSLARLVAYARSERVELVHSTDRPRDAVAAVVLGRLLRIPSVVHLHVAWAEWMQRSRRWALAHADAVVAVSDFVAASIPEAVRDPATVHTVLNGIDPMAWTPGKDRDGAREELDIEPGAPVVLTACRLMPSKGVELLLRSLPALARAHPGVRLVVVGDDEVQPGYLRHLEGMARDLGVAGQVQFCGLRRDVPRLMAAADVFALPSLGEPFGLAFAEAMAMELPVVGLADGGTPEVVEHRRTGLLSPPDDLPALTAHLDVLLSDPELRRDLGVAGRERVERMFTVERMAADVAAVHRHVLNGGS